MLLNRREFVQGALAVGATTLVAGSAIGAGASHRASVMDFGADSTGVRDSTLAVQRAIASLSRDDSRLVFPAGHYRFEASADVVMMFEGFRGIEVYANDAVMHFSGGLSAFHFTSCRNVALHDMKLDWLDASAASLHAPSVLIAASEDVLVEGVTLSRGPGPSLVADNCRNVRIEGTRFVQNAAARVPERVEPALVLRDCHGDVQIREASFEGVSGDGLRIFQSYWKTVRRIDDRSVQIEDPRSGSLLRGSQFLRAGDFVQFSSPSDLKLLGEIAVASVQVGTEGAVLTFNETLSPVIIPGTLVCSVVDAPKAIIEHCLFSGTGGRGVVVKARADILNCHFQGCQQAAILLAPSLQTMEGPVVQNVNIRMNTFEQCDEGEGLPDRGVVVIASRQEEEDSMPTGLTINSGVRIEANTFRRQADKQDGPFIYAADIYGLLIEKNKFHDGSAAKAAPISQPAIILSNVSEADLTANVANVPLSIEMKQCADTVAAQDNQLMTVHRSS